MTPQEAIERIKKHNEIHSKKEMFAIHITEALQMGISALEKQIPKKVAEYKINAFCCPICKSVRYPESPYCEHCGQALDWSDT